MFGLFRQRRPPAAPIGSDRKRQLEAAIDHGFNALVDSLSRRERLSIDVAMARTFYGMGFCDAIGLHNDGKTISEQELER